MIDIHQTYQLALEVIHDCTKKNNIFFASAGTEKDSGYNSLWTRDFCHTLFGIIAAQKTHEFQESILLSIKYIFQYQLPSGQIPTNVDIWSDRPENAYYQTVDSTLLLLLVIHLLPDNHELLQTYQSHIEHAYRWIADRDNGSGLIEQQETTDWLDTIPNQGNVLSTNVLFYFVLKILNKQEKAKEIFSVLQEKFSDVSLGYVYPWIWKVDHGTYCDTLGNCLMLLINLLPNPDSQIVLSFLEKECSIPYPIRALMPPITPQNRWWRNAIDICASRKPFAYQNGGVWSCVGGWYIFALIAQGKTEEAQKQLTSLAQANTQNQNFLFPEWLDGISGTPNGQPKQAWSAGMYLAAYEAVKNNTTIFSSLLVK